MLDHIPHSPQSMLDSLIYQHAWLCLHDPSVDLHEKKKKVEPFSCMKDTTPTCYDIKNTDMTRGPISYRSYLGLMPLKHHLEPIFISSIKYAIKRSPYYSIKDLTTLTYKMASEMPGTRLYFILSNPSFLSTLKSWYEYPTCWVSYILVWYW